METTHGIDISHYNGPDLQFGELKNAGVSFVIAKATEKLDVVDSLFLDNYARAKAAGMLRSAYHFFHPELDPVAQADFFCQTVPFETGDMRLALDVETLARGGQNFAGWSIKQDVQSCVDQIKANTGMYPWLYSGVSFYQTYLSGVTGCSLWLAEYGVSSPKIVPLPAIWQYTDSQSWNGAPNPVDSNVFFGTLDDLTCNNLLTVDAASSP